MTEPLIEYRGILPEPAPEIGGPNEHAIRFNLGIAGARNRFGSSAIHRLAEAFKGVAAQAHKNGEWAPSMVFLTDKLSVKKALLVLMIKRREDLKQAHRFAREAVTAVNTTPRWHERPGSELRFEEELKELAEFDKKSRPLAEQIKSEGPAPKAGFLSLIRETGGQLLGAKRPK